MARHYLDFASTSPLRPVAKDAISAWLESESGDPSRNYGEARNVRAQIEAGRDSVASFFGVRPRQVIFTSGATEAANTATYSAAQSRKGAIGCAKVEHSCVRNASLRFAEVVDIAVAETGSLRLDSLADLLNQSETNPLALVHCQWGNHEVGTIQPVEEVVALCHEKGVPVHIDAAAGAGQVPMDLGALNADFVSVSAHKFGGPPGIGALILGSRSRLSSPLILGGLQERARRAGLENVPGILAFAAVLRQLASGEPLQLVKENAQARDNLDRLWQACLQTSGVTAVGPSAKERLPHILCLGVEGIEAEPILIGLDRKGFAIHSGSACSSEAWEPSPVLEALGVPSHHSLRISVGWSTTESDIEAFGDAFVEVVSDLRALKT